jgi:hypothetical protein
MVGRRYGQVGPADLAAGQAQALERLRTGHFVDQVPIDVQNGLLAMRGMDDVKLALLDRAPGEEVWVEVGRGSAAARIKRHGRALTLL